MWLFDYKNMIKKLDQYIIKTFFGPFLFIFSVLCFIFIVNIIWIQMGNLAGKGLTSWEMTKLFSYLGVTVIKMVLPLTILLAAIMTFGDFGEHYELAAMKSSGISLTRIMQPLFIVTILLSLLLYLFSNNIIPDFQRKAKNMLYNIVTSRPALNFTPGQFISTMPGMTIKFDEINGENGEKVKGVFIHKVANAYEDKQTVTADHGKFMPTNDPHYLKLILYKGAIYQDNVANKDFLQKKRQENQVIKFDSLVQHFDVSALLKKGMEEENIQDDYQFQTFAEIGDKIEQQRKRDGELFQIMTSELVGQQLPYLPNIDKRKIKKEEINPPFKLDTLKKDQKLEALYNTYLKVDNFGREYKMKESQIADMVNYYSKIVMYQQRIIAYSITCVIFFLIGASLGSIIRKGGVGLPVINAIVIFILYYVLNLWTENLAWKGRLEPYLATWLPNIVLFPFGVWLTVKALTDSQLFDPNKYFTFVKPALHYFKKGKQIEHTRYQ